MAEFSANEFDKYNFNSGQEISNDTILGKDDIMSLPSGLLWITEEHVRLSDEIRHKVYGDIEPRVSTNERNIDIIAAKVDEYDTRISDVEGFATFIYEQLAETNASLETTNEKLYADIEPRVSSNEAEIVWLKNVANSFVTMNTYTDTFVTRKTETPDGKVIISNVDTEVLSVKGETVNQDGTLTNAIFNGITSVSADESNASFLTMPTEVELAFADTLNVTEGKIVRYTSAPFTPTANSNADVFTNANGVVWAQYWRTDIKSFGIIVANIPTMNRNTMTDNYMANTTDPTMRVADKEFSRGFIRLVVGTLEDVAGEGATSVTQAQVASYLAEKGVVFLYECKTERATETVTVSRSYIAYNGGTETVEGNGIPVTVTQKFLVKV